MNYLARYAHFEHPELIIFSLSPGWVQTEMGNLGARTAGREKAPITVEESVGTLRMSSLQSHHILHELVQFHLCLPFSGILGGRSEDLCFVD